VTSNSDGAIVSGHFIEGGRARIFVLLRQPLRPVEHRCVLVVPPFAEEMNKCRRMVTVTALRLAYAGLGVIVPDLNGTGDSEGEFHEADWSSWIADLSRSCDWARNQGLEVSGFLAIRLGAALAGAAVASGALPSVARTVLWQPVFDGARYLSQFLRLRVAAMLTERDQKESVADLRAHLARGRIMEVAGYGLSGRMAAALDAVAAPERLPAQLGQTLWTEVVRGATGELPVPSTRLVEQTRTAGGYVRVETFQGEPFWATTEITSVPDLVRTTVEFLSTPADLGQHQVSQ